MPGSGTRRHQKYISYQGAFSITEKANMSTKRGVRCWILMQSSGEALLENQVSVYTPEISTFSDLRIHSFIHSITQQIANIEFHTPGIVLGLFFFFPIESTHYMFTFLFLPTEPSSWRTQTVFPVIKHLIFIIQYLLKQYKINSYELALLEEKENKKEPLEMVKVNTFRVLPEVVFESSHHSSLQGGQMVHCWHSPARNMAFAYVQPAIFNPIPRPNIFRVVGVEQNPVLYQKFKTIIASHIF